MSGFDALDLSPDLVEALSAEGIETPTHLQEQLIPLVRRGNNVVAVAGPGSGIMAAWAAPLLERLPAEGEGPRIVVLTSTADRAAGLAESLARLAQVTGHRVTALDPLWVLPDRGDVVVATAEEAAARLAAGHLSLEAVQAVVVDDASGLGASGALAPAATLVEGLSPDAQRIVVSLPLTEAVEAFAGAHLRKAVHVPPRSTEAAAETPPHRGTLKVLEFGGPRELATLQAVARLFLEARHVMAWVRSEDAAADLGDFLGLRGYQAGRPGDTEAPVWLAVEALEGRNALDESGIDDVAVLSVDVPGDADTLDRRHGAGREGVVLALPREIPHLRAVAREAGYGMTVGPLEGPAARPSGLSRLMAQLDETMGTADVEAYRALLEPIFEKHGAASVAAAAVALLREQTKAAPSVADAPPPPDRVQSFVRLFVSVGKRDNVGPGDLVGAIAGEAGVNADLIGRIDLKDSFALVEVEQAVAEKVMKALNGTSI
ncbi:MAG TPA: DEAD/DEAH box helicase, partial [Longimicrobiales bacterium]|nr:DEAD/DEAH box helicase [Longimicrobiales bacterium]